MALVSAWLLPTAQPCCQRIRARRGHDDALDNTLHHRQRSLVDAKVWIVDVPDRAFFLVAAADEQKRSRDFLLIRGEIRCRTGPDRQAATFLLRSALQSPLWRWHWCRHGCCQRRNPAASGSTARAVGRRRPRQYAAPTAYLLAHLLIMSTVPARALSGITL